MDYTTGLIELLWSSISAVGAVVSAVGIVGVIDDLGKLPPFTNGRKILGRSLSVTESLRFTVQLAWLIQGLFLIRNPDNIITWNPTVIMLLVSNFFLLLKTLILIFTRIYIRNH